MRMTGGGLQGSNAGGKESETETMITSSPLILIVVTGRRVLPLQALMENPL